MDGDPRWASAHRSVLSLPRARDAVGYHRRMVADEETIVHVTAGASWLPPGGRAEVIRRPTPPAPMCVVRLLIRQADTVFCVPRPDTGDLDLPMRVVGSDDPSGVLDVAGLAEGLTGHGTHLTFVGAVRNVVESPPSGYRWPVPHAHFGVWRSEDTPIIAGEWVGIGDASPLRDRHWFPLVS